MYRILLIEDDEVIGKVLKKSLEVWGYLALIAEDFENIMKTFAAFDPQLVIMDISLPFYNGYHWCTKIREVSKVPILFLSSTSDNMNIVMAVNMGGDDFVAKPFDLDVLLAKIQALLRRTYDFSGSTNILEHKGAILNCCDATLLYQETKIPLTKNEFRILSVLIEHKGSIVSRDQIMSSLWETDSFIDDNTLTVNINRLRKKLEESGLAEYVVTKKGIGYGV